VSAVSSELTPQLRAALLKRRGVALALWGEAGIGKTYAAQGLLHTLPCRAFSVHAALPLAQWLGVLPESPRLPLWAARLCERLGRAEHLGADEIAQALGARLGALAPCVLHLEDVHEVLPERLELLLALARTARGSRGVGLLVTSRVELPKPFGSVRLAPLTPDASAALLQSEVGASLPPDALGWIYARAAGNPLFTLEYLRLLSRQGYLWNDGHRWRWRPPVSGLMPVTVEALIEGQLEGAQQDPDLAATLQSGALLPQGATDAQWAEVSSLSLSALAAAKLELSRRGLFRGGTFSHPLYREVTRNILPKRTRQALAKRRLTVFADDPAQVASAIDDAGLEPGRALELLKRSAAQATAAENDLLAGELLAKAAGYATGEERAALTLEAASALQHGNLPRATHLLEALLEEHPDHTGALYLCARLYARDHDEEKAEATLARLPAQERESQRGVEASLEVYGLLENASKTLALWQQHRERPFRPEVVARVVAVFSNEAQQGAATDLARTTLARTDLSSWERAVLLNALGLVYSDAAEHERAEGLFSELLDLLAQVGNRRAFVVLYNRALARKWLGRYLGAKEDALGAHRLASEAGDGHMVGMLLSLLAELTVELGDYEQAEAYIRESLEVLGQRQLTRHLIDAQTTASELYGAWRGPQSGFLALKHARVALQHAQELANDLSLMDALHFAAMAEASFGSPARALELVAELESLAAQTDNVLGRYYAAWSKGAALKALGRSEEARASFQSAFDLAQRAKHLVNAHKLGLELAHLERDLKSARDHLVWFEARGLMNGVSLATRYFPELAAAEPAPNVTPSALRLEVLGPLRVTRDGKPYPVRGERRKTLLGLLLEAHLAGRTGARTLDLCTALYPDEDERGAGRSLKQLVFQLRHQLGPGVITTTPDGYALGAVASDAAAFLESGDTTLWRGLYLEDAESRDETVRGTLYEALKARLADLLEPDPTEAARVGHILVEAEPYDAEVLRLTVRALRRLGNVRAAGTLYRKGRERMLEVGERLPESWQAFLESKTS